MKSFLKIFFLCLMPSLMMAQRDPNWGYISNQQADSLRLSLKTEINDTLNMAAFRNLGFYYQENKPDSALYFHQQQLALSKKLNMKLWEADAHSQLGYVFELLGNTTKAYESFSEAMKIAKMKKRFQGTGMFGHFQMQNHFNMHGWLF